MNIKTTFDENPAEGVRLIKALSVEFAKPFEINEIFVRPRSKTPVDQHQVAEFWHILSGGGQLFYKNNTYKLVMGDWFFFYPYEQHQVDNTGDIELKILSLYWK